MGVAQSRDAFTCLALDAHTLDPPYCRLTVWLSRQRLACCQPSSAAVARKRSRSGG